MSSKSSTEGPGSVLVGRVLRAHGLRGEAVVEPVSDNPERFVPGAELWVAPPAPAAAPAELRTIATVREHRGALLVRFADVDDRDGAEALRGRELSVPLAAVPPPPEGTWYHFQLLGLRVSDAAAGELGEVVDLVEDGGGLLLVVDDGRRRVPVPFVRAFLRRVDVEGGRLELELPPGLVETCASGS